MSDKEKPKRPQISCDATWELKKRVANHSKKLGQSEASYIRSTLIKDMDLYDQIKKGTQ